jgi:hypothetical protein
MTSQFQLRLGEGGKFEYERNAKNGLPPLQTSITELVVDSLLEKSIFDSERVFGVKYFWCCWNAVFMSQNKSDLYHRFLKCLSMI